MKKDNDIKQLNLLSNYCYKSGIEKTNTLFGSDYFNDNFRIIGFSICIDFLNTPYDEAVQKNADFLKFVKNKKDLVCIRIDNYWNPHFLYRIFTKSDYIALQEHDERQQKAIDNYNLWRHYLIEKYGIANVM